MIKVLGNITSIIPLLVIMLQGNLFSQELKFSRIGAQEGLSQSVVNCVMQDKKGFMWFGTDDGLNRYDGYEMRILKNIPDNKNSLSNNGILCLYEDKQGILWIGTNGGGLNACDPVTNTFNKFMNDPQDPQSISSNVIKTIFEDREKNLWIGTESGLNLIDRKTKKFTRFTLQDGLKNDRIWNLCEDKDGLLWLATYGGGLHSFDKKSKKFTQHPDLGMDGEIRIRNSEKLRHVFCDSGGILWIGTHGASLSSYDKNTRYFTYYTISEEEESVVVTGIFEDSKGILWIGTRNGLVAFTDKYSRTLEPKPKESILNFVNIESNDQSLSHNSISDICEDRASSIWIGTNGGGVSAYHKTSNKFGHFHRNENSSLTLSSNKTYAFAEDMDENLWIGTYEGGISMLNRKLGTFTNYPKSINNTHSNVLCLYIDSEELLWFGTWGGGINYYDLKKQRFGKQPFENVPNKNSLCNNSVLCITEDKEGLLWIGTFKGLNTYDKKTRLFRKYSTEDGLSNNTIQTLLFDSKGNLWIGTGGGGLCFMDLKTGKIRTYSENKGNKGVSSNIINCIHEDKKGNIWIGTVMGLCKMNENETFEHFFEKDGLPNDYIYGILEDELGFLWLSSNKGLSKFNPAAKEGDPNRFRNYLVLDGLQDYEFNQGAFYKNKNGEMFFGGQNGFNAFFPQQIIDNKHIPPVHISSFKIYGKDVPMDTGITDKKNIELSYRDNFFSFEFVALDYILPAKNLYSFKMEGLDQDWNPPSTRRYANYTDLSGGDYIFRVKAANNDGMWNEEGASIRIRIIPPFWKTNWFYALCVITGILSIFLFIRIRTEQIQNEKRILEKKVAERTNELAQKNKDITDSIQYAKRIQDAILPTRENIFKQLPDSFILFKPKDIVSGDFYWFYKKDTKKIIAAVDCTGHGVPGAFMSMIGQNLLNQIVIEKGITNPAKILADLNNGVQDALKQKGVEGETMDGMDVALCTIDSSENEIEFAGAFRPLYLIRKKNLEKIEGSKFPIGGVQHEKERIFECCSRKISRGDMIYLFSDGYADQFGLSAEIKNRAESILNNKKSTDDQNILAKNSLLKGKKFMTKRFQEILLEIHQENPSLQAALLEQRIDEWRGHFEQVDDILVIGIRF